MKCPSNVYGPSGIEPQTSTYRQLRAATATCGLQFLHF